LLSIGREGILMEEGQLERVVKLTGKGRAVSAGIRGGGKGGKKQSKNPLRGRECIRLLR